jgi:hypothetical protein
MAIFLGPTETSIHPELSSGDVSKIQEEVRACRKIVKSADDAQ